MEKKATIKYLLTQRGQKASILAGGNGKMVQEIETDITPQLLEVATVSCDGNVMLNLTRNLSNHIVVGVNGQTTEISNPLKPYLNLFDKPQTAEQLVDWETERREYLKFLLKSMEPEIATRKAEYLRVIKQNQIDEKERIKLQKEKAARAEDEKLVALQEKTDWIAHYGSDHLKQTFAFGYNCQRLYATERANVEHPKFNVDFDSNARWKARSCPSMIALDEVKKLVTSGINAEVVWLTHPERYFEEIRNGEEHSWESCEAIVIYNFLGKYNLVKKVSQQKA